MHGAFGVINTAGLMHPDSPLIRRSDVMMKKPRVENLVTLSL
jgi:hypothetical protein